MGGKLCDCLIPAQLDVFFLLLSIILPNGMENLHGSEQLPENRWINYTEKRGVCIQGSTCVNPQLDEPKNRKKRGGKKVEEGGERRKPKRDPIVLVRIG